jgi:hypothetical protein
MPPPRQLPRKTSDALTTGPTCASPVQIPTSRLSAVQIAVQRHANTPRGSIDHDFGSLGGHSPLLRNELHELANFTHLWALSASLRSEVHLPISSWTSTKTPLGETALLVAARSAMPLISIGSAFARDSRQCCGEGPPSRIPKNAVMGWYVFPFQGVGSGAIMQPHVSGNLLEFAAVLARAPSLSREGPGRLLFSYVLSGGA